MDWTAAMTLAFAGIGAATGLLTFGNEISKRRAERRGREEEAAALWTLTAGATQDPSRWTLTFRYDAPQDAPIMAQKITVIEPAGASLAQIKRARRAMTVQDPEPTDEGWNRSISVGRDLDAGILLGPGQVGFASYATMRYLAQLAPGASERAGRARFRISLTIEDRSALRRQRKLIVVSQEIAWTANSADNAT